jgi:hypothetical protein
VRSHWWDTAYALGFVREFYRTVGPERLYEVQEDPRGVIRLRSGAATREDYDVSFDVDQVRRGYDEMTKPGATPRRVAPARGGRGSSTASSRCSGIP